MAAAAAYRVEEEQLWKCPKHPSKRRRHGVCPSCLRDRLVTLCPNCGNVRPCPCNASASSPSSSNSSSGEPTFGRSRSLAIPFFLRSTTNRDNNTSSSSSFMSVFRRSKSKKGGEAKKDEEGLESNERIEDFAKMISRSRSVGMAAAPGFWRDDVNSSSSPPSGKGKFWNLKAFRSSKNPNKAASLQDQSSSKKV